MPVPRRDPHATLAHVDRKRGQAANVFEQVSDLHDLYRRAVVWYNDKVRWSVTVRSDDRLYSVVHRWFLSGEVDTRPPRAVKAVYKSAARSSSAFLDEISGAGYRASRGKVGDQHANVDIQYDESGSRLITIDGHKVSVTLTKPEEHTPSDQGYRVVRPDSISFHARSYEGQQAVIALLRRLADDSEKRKPVLYMMTTWGDWARRDDLPQRQLRSVCLASGQMERIAADLQEFLDAEGDYVRRGMPYHRGYLLHGAPGTGKTSVVKALAAHFNLDLWYAPLGDLTKDSGLLSMISQVQPGSILLLEDIDVFQSATSRDSEKETVSMAGLLNALDGVATPHGLITFMTTNDLQAIDPAIVRRGRVDLLEHIGLPTPEQIVRLYNFWYSTELPDNDARRVKWSGTTADATEVFKQNLDNPQEALRVLQGSAPIAVRHAVPS